MNIRFEATDFSIRKCRGLSKNARKMQLNCSLKKEASVWRAFIGIFRYLSFHYENQNVSIEKKE